MLKGTRIKIANDLTFKQRQEGQILRKHLNVALLYKKKYYKIAVAA